MYRDDFQSTQHHQTNEFTDFPEVPYDEEYDEYYGSRDVMDSHADESSSFEGLMSMTDLFEQCVVPVLSQVFDHFKLLLLFCFFYKLTQHALYKGVALKLITPSLCIHLLNSLSTILGVFTLYSFYHNNCIFILIIIATIFPLLLLTHNKCKAHSGYIVSAVVIIYLVTCEVFIVNTAVWHNIRGTQMIICMKLISLAFDLTSQPSLLSYLGYVLHVGSVVLGPWVSFHDHSTSLATPSTHLLDFWWVTGVVACVFGSLSCLLVSTCLSLFLLPDSSSSLWALAYRDALSFRFSHYFVCKASQLTLFLSGGGEVAVTKVSAVEMPRSLTSVVAVWNMPMHKWLKNYVFKAWLPHGSATAILTTYLASSLLHGLNFQLSAVLLSLGAFTYVEHKVRARLAEWLNACVLSKACKPNCKHKYQASSITCSLLNMLLSATSLLHLTYLGLMFDSSETHETGYSMAHTLSKWKRFYFCSHVIVIVVFLLHFLI